MDHLVAFTDAGVQAVRPESALARPQASVFGEDAYPAIHQKAAGLLHSMATNHALGGRPHRNPPRPACRPSVILIDTSAWIEYLRGTGSAAAVEVRRLLSTESDRVVTCEPVAMEILAGAIGDERHAKLERLVNGLPSLRIDDALDFRSAATTYRTARRAGHTIRSINDCLIAALAIRHGASIVHRDADFEAIVAITGVDARSFR